jgi:hypothetical protein
VRTLVLITPSGRAVGLEPDVAARREIVRLRRDEPWFAESAAAFERVAAGTGDDQDWAAMAPFRYGRRDAAARAHDAAGGAQANEDAADAGHFPWLDDAHQFVSTVNAFLAAGGFIPAWGSSG